MYCHYLQENTDYKHIYHHYLHQFPHLVNHYPEIYGPPSETNLFLEHTLFPMIVVFTLFGDSDIHIPPQIFELLQKMPPDTLSVATVDTYLMENLACSAARRCINSLMHDTSLLSAKFALEFLSRILPKCEPSPDINEACLQGQSSSDFTGDYGLSALARSAYTAMQEYRERYAKAQLAGTE